MVGYNYVLTMQFLTIYLQTPKKETFHPEILKKSNQILRNCKTADIGILMYGIPDLTIPRLRFYEFG